MLRISTTDTANQRRLIVEGKLIAPWTRELRVAYDNAKTKLESRELVIDLKNLTIISREGEDLITQMMNEGVKFHCSGLFARLLLRQLAERSRAHRR